MNMPLNNTLGIDHEWSVTCHDEFSKLPIRKYEKEDVYIWSAYQGMNILNRMVSDLHDGVANITLESIVDDRKNFTGLVDYLTQGRVSYGDDLLDVVYATVNIPSRGDDALLLDTGKEYDSWPDWKKEAFEIIVKDDTKKMFLDYGYAL